MYSTLLPSDFPTLKSEDASLHPSLTIHPPELGYEKTSRPLAYEPFVTSFSEYKDSLMHWRSYCPEQSGVAIGFRVACLEEARIDEGPQAGMLIPPMGFAKISYVDASDENVIDKLIRRAQVIAKFRYAEAHIPKDKNDLDSRLPEFFSWAVEALACSSKHSSFQHEGEHRLLLGNIGYRENNLRFRPVRSTLVPYVPIHIPSISEAAGDQNYKSKPWDAIANIVIGPTANMDLTTKAVDAFFRIRSMNVAIEPSAIPYRDW